MEVGVAFSLIRSAIDQGRPAHGYLIVGGVRTNGAELVSLVLRHLFPDAVDQVEAGSHPDVVRLEPEGKSRVITVDSMRERIVGPMAETAFSGGWKVGVVVCADRLNPQSANAFLKSLEEPTPKTMYLLLTDQPDALLPTIVSRCQRIDLKLPPGTLEGEAYEAVAEVFSGALANGFFEKALAARRLAEILAGLKEAAADEDVALVRKSFFRTVMAFVREWMVGGKLPRHQAFANVEAVEEAYRRSERSIPDEATLAFMMDRMVIP